MQHWTPNSTNAEMWQPRSGWNCAFSNKDKLQYVNLFFFFKNKKGFTESAAEIMAQMAIFKQKYPGMKYSDEQEEILYKALTPIFNT